MAILTTPAEHRVTQKDAFSGGFVESNPRQPLKREMQDGPQGSEESDKSEEGSGS
jgi:hypothetical protein